MAAPLIGITTYGPDDVPPKFSLPAAYIDAVLQVGGRAILLAPAGLTAADVLELVDGLILAGGGDIDPSSYGGGEHETVYMVSPQRDAFEIELVKRALDRPDMPLLGICRGMQVMNVALGGDLDLHVPDVYGEEVIHRLPPREPTQHPVRVEPGSVLETICGAREFPVSSWHHQSVRRLGSHLRPVAHAADGVIEGCIYERHPFALGVQWHPELQVADDPRQRRLFGALVAQAGERA